MCRFSCLMGTPKTGGFALWLSFEAPKKQVPFKQTNHKKHVVLKMGPPQNGGCPCGFPLKPICLFEEKKGGSPPRTPRLQARPRRTRRGSSPRPPPRPGAVHRKKAFDFSKFLFVGNFLYICLRLI